MFKPECTIDWIDEDEFFVIFQKEVRPQMTDTFNTISREQAWDAFPKSYEPPYKDTIKPKTKT